MNLYGPGCATGRMLFEIFKLIMFGNSSFRISQLCFFI